MSDEDFIKNEILEHLEIDEETYNRFLIETNETSKVI